MSDIVSIVPDKAKRKHMRHDDATKAAAVKWAKKRGPKSAMEHFEVSQSTISNWIKDARAKVPRAKPGRKPKPAVSPVTSAAEVLHSIGLDPGQWSIVHSSGLKLR